MRTKSITAVLAGALCLGAITAGHAGLSDREKALWGASEQAPTTFALPAGQDAAVMARALSLISGWSALDRYMAAMPVQTSTATLIQTGDPIALNMVGFRVLDTRTADGSVITIDTSAFEGKAFETSRQHRDANKRAHLLAYLLEQYAGVPTVAPPPAPALAPGPLPPPVAPSPAVTPSQGTGPADSFAPSLDKLRFQLGARQYDAALQTLDGLRASVAAKAGAVTPGGR